MATTPASLVSHLPLDRSDVDALRRGDAQAFDRAVERWRRPLTAFAARYLRDPGEARDVAAETFVRLHRHRERLRPDTNLSAWLFTTAANLCRNRHRWRVRHPTVPLGAEAERMAAEGRAPDEALQHDELVEALRLAVGELPHDLRVTLLLHQYERLSHRGIGAIVGCSEKGVETRLYRARQRLRRRLVPFLADPRLSEPTD